ncbi:chloride channel protein [Nitrincola iocasae]|uniref:chloride channel protein n=1 Tax=Nitrincola iocasae TaxID=2614693 RepID=UPI001CD91CC8|nr:chloride channel protein [Nitrincola iocasae]
MAGGFIKTTKQSALKQVSLIIKVAGLGLVIGITGAILANAFVAGVQWLNDALLVAFLNQVKEEYSLAIIVAATVAVPTLGGLLVGILLRSVKEQRAHTPADIIAAVQTRRGRLPLRPAILSGLAALVSLGSGASVGQYGPLVHMGGSLGSAWGRLFRADVTLDNIAIACGVAAAISTVFNAPIAGILFAHEVILRHYAFRAFAPVAVASVVGYLAANVILPQPPLLYIEAASVLHHWEYGLFLLLGIASALLAVGYMQAILLASRVAQRWSLPNVFKPAFAGALLGLMALWVPEILGVGGETLRLIFVEGSFGAADLLILLVLKLIATALCLGFGFAGGVFSPALLIGSLFGALFGTLLGMVLGDSVALSSLAVYAVCGMIAVTAPVIGAPLSTVVIIFELTGNYELTIAALASVALANLFASQWFDRSLFDRQLRDRGLDLSGGRSKALLMSRSIQDLTSDRYLSLPEQVTVGEACRSMAQVDSSDAYIVDANQRYLGTVHLASLIGIDVESAAKAYIIAEDCAIQADTSLWTAMVVLRNFIGEGVPVIDAQQHIVGAVFESDLIRAYLDLMEDMRKEEYAAP